MSVHRSTFVITTKEENVARIDDLEGEEEEDHVAGAWAAIDKVPVEDVVHQIDV